MTFGGHDLARGTELQELELLRKAGTYSAEETWNLDRRQPTYLVPSIGLINQRTTHRA